MTEFRGTATSIPLLAGAFDANLQLKGRTASTRRKYRAALGEFERWADGRAAAELTGQDIQLFLSEWTGRFEERYARQPSAATQKGLITALKSFYDYAERFDFLLAGDGSSVKNPMSAIDAPTIPQKANDWLHAEEDQALLEAPATAAEEIVVWLLRWTGLRMSEARNLRWSDLDFTTTPRPRLLVLQSKTAAGKRTIPIFPELEPRILRWRDHLETEGLYLPTGPVLVTRSKQPMQHSYIGRVVKRVAYRAGVRRVECTCGSSTVSFHTHACAQTANGERRSEISAHTLRRTFGSHLLNSGLRIEAVSKLLGHTNIKITQDAYAELLDQTVLNDLAQTLGWAA